LANTHSVTGRSVYVKEKTSHFPHFLQGGWSNLRAKFAIDIPQPLPQVGTGNQDPGLPSDSSGVASAKPEAWAKEGTGEQQQQAGPATS